MVTELLNVPILGVIRAWERGVGREGGGVSRRKCDCEMRVVTAPLNVSVYGVVRAWVFGVGGG